MPDTALNPSIPSASNTSNTAIGEIRLFGVNPNISVKAPQWLRCDGSTVAAGQFPLLMPYLSGQLSFNLFARTQPVAQQTGGGAFGASTYCVSVISGAGSTMLTSSDAISWTSRTAVGSLGLGPVLYSNSAFIVGARNTTANNIQTSSDGVTWTSRWDAGASNDAIYGLASDGTAIVAVSYDGSGNGCCIEAPTPTGTYTKRLSVFIGNIMYSVAYGSGVYVAVGGNSTVYRSLNRTTWTAQTSGISADLRLVFYHSQSGLFIAWGTPGGVVITSPDGVSWTQRTGGAYTNGWSTSSQTGGATSFGASGAFVFGGWDGTNAYPLIGGENLQQPWITRKGVTTAGPNPINQLASSNSLIFGGIQINGGFVSTDPITGGTLVLPNIPSPGGAANYWLRAA